MPQEWTLVPESNSAWTPVPDANDSIRPVSMNEPDTYWSGALKGATEGMAGGAKGFVEGLAHSPASFVNGIVSMLTTNPLTTASEAIAAIKRLPDAIRQAGVDPESWGQDVGDVTGQTMIGIAAPAVARGTMRGAQAVAASPLAGKIIPPLVKHGATAAGAYLGGPAGAIVGTGVGEQLAGALRTKPSVVQQIGKIAGKAPKLEAAIESALNDLRASQPSPAGPARLPEYPQAATDTMRMLQERPAASPAPRSATPPPTPRPAPEVVPPPAAAPTPAPIARAPFNPNTALKAARDRFAAIGEVPRPAEVTNAMELIRTGKTPEDAVAFIIGKRPKVVNPAAELAARFGMPSDEDVRAAIDSRNARGQIKTPSAQTARERAGR